MLDQHSDDANAEAARCPAMEMLVLVLPDTTQCLLFTPQVGIGARFIAILCIPDTWLRQLLKPSYFIQYYVHAGQDQTNWGPEAGCQGWPIARAPFS